MRIIVSAFLGVSPCGVAAARRTRAAFVARSRVNTVLVNRHAKADAVILITANSGYRCFHGARRPRLFIYTDYGNLLSKALPERGFALDERKTPAVWNRLERETLAIQECVFVMGKHVKPAMEAAYGLAAEKVVAVGAGPGLDVDIERDAGTKDPAGRTILFVGKLAPVKGLAVLLQAFAIVRAAYPDAALHVVTGDPVAAPGLFFTAGSMSASSRSSSIAAACSPCRHSKNRSGLVFLEAMWSKCACVGTTTGSMPEYPGRGDGMSVAPGDVRALGGTPQRPARGSGRHTGDGRARLRRRQGYWSWDAVVERMLKRARASRSKAAA